MAVFFTSLGVVIMFMLVGGPVLVLRSGAILDCPGLAFGAVEVGSTVSVLIAGDTGRSACHGGTSGAKPAILSTWMVLWGYERSFARGFVVLGLVVGSKDVLVKGGVSGL